MIPGATPATTMLAAPSCIARSAHDHREDANDKTEVFPPTKESASQSKEADKRNLGNREAEEIADATVKWHPSGQRSADKNSRDE